MKSANDKLEESVGKGESKEPDDKDSDQLYTQELASALGEKTFLLVDESVCDHTPNATEEMSLCRLKWVIKLESVQNLGAEQVDYASNRANDEG